VLEEEDDESDDDDEDDLDAALDGILGQASSTPSGSSSAATRRITVQHSPMPAPLVEEDVDWTSGDAATKELLFTGNPRWTAAGLNPAIIDVLSSRGITHFTPVQAEAFAPVLARRDVIGRSRTGTGKTLAFGLPSITRLLDFMAANGKRDQNSGQMRRGRTPSMLVLCPTRELARQVSDELAAVAKPVGLFVEVFHGGVSYDPQARALRTGVDIIVGTPGRIIDHLNRGNMDLTECDIVVLDEADEMLNMGFSEDVEVRIDIEVAACSVR
jgi:superfamily II DNA/RNA helicase